MILFVVSAPELLPIPPPPDYQTRVELIPPRLRRIR